jgi:hypothetical protein
VSSSDNPEPTPAFLLSGCAGTLSSEAHEATVVFDVSVDRFGKVTVLFQPLALTADTAWLLKPSFPGDLAIPRLRVTGIAPAGEHVSSDAVYILSAGTPQKDGVAYLDIRGQAEPLRVAYPPLSEPHARRQVSYRTVGMRGGPGTASSQAPEGKVWIGGPHIPRDYAAIHGAIDIETTEDRPLPEWLTSCDELASRVRDIFSLGQGRFIQQSVRELYLDEKLVQLDFYGPKSSTEPYQPVFHHLNRQPVLDLAVQSYTPALQNERGLGIAIEWLLMHPNYTEGKYLTAFAALEHLLAVNGKHIPTTILSPDTFKASVLRHLANALDEARKALPDASTEAFAMLRGKLDNLNQRPLTVRLTTLLKHLQVPTTDIDDRIPAALRARNHLLHRGRYTDDKPLYQHLTVLREVVVRFILTMLAFQGSYESYLCDPTWGSFPPATKTTPHADA